MTVLTNYLDNVNYPVFTSFYTRNTGYETVVVHLIETLEKFKLPYHIEAIDSFGKWTYNCAYKPFHISKVMKIYERSIVWIDADATIERDPVLFRIENNVVLKSVGCHFLKINKKGKKTNELLSGTLFIRNDDVSTNIIDEWKALCESDRNVWDQQNLQKIYNTASIHFGNLPITYIKIFDYKSQSGVNPVIQHWQASRKYKNKV